jgi:SAM-dependent methyltransferase
MVATGVDAGDFTEAFALLNKLLGGDARFVQAQYEPTKYDFVPTIVGQFDVVSCMAFLIHVPEPLHLLRYIADRARHAVFLWSGFPRDDAMIVRYPKLHQFSNLPFPWSFDAGVAISDSLLIYAMSEIGFPNVVEILPPADGWPPVCGNPLMAPYEPLRGFLFTRSTGVRVTEPQLRGIGRRIRDFGESLVSRI